MDVYKIGVSIALANGVSAVLGVIQKDVMGLKKAVDLTNGSLSRMKVAVLGMAAIGFGGAMLTGLDRLEKKAEKYTEQLELMKVAGMTAAEQQASIFAANRVASSVRTTDPTENLQAVRELRAALNSAGASPHEATEEAIKYLDVVQKAQLVMQATAGGRAAAAGGGVYEMVKALEEIGATKSPERFERLLGGMVKASEAFGGKINARDWFQTLKYTRGAGQFYSDDFIANYLPTLMQEMKSGTGSGSGGGPGNPLASLFQEVVGNTFGIKTRDLGIKLGLIDPSKSVLDKHGRIHNAPGAWYGADQAASNPALWAQQFLIPVLSRQMSGHMMDRTADGQYVHVKEMATTLATLFGNRTAQQMINLLMQVQKMEGDKKLIEQTQTMNDAAAELSAHNPATVMEQFNKQLERLEVDLGKVLVPLKAGVFSSLTDGLTLLAELSERHPNAVKWIVAVTTALAGLLTVVGAFALVGAALAAIPGGFIITGIAIAIGAFGAAIYWLWKHVDWNALGTAIRDCFDRMVAAVRGWIAGAPALAAEVGTALANVGKAILDWAIGLPARIGQALLDGVGIKPPIPGTESHPNGVPKSGPLFGPQNMGDPSHAPGLYRQGSYVPPRAGGQHITVAVRGEVDGRTLLQFVTAGLVRSGSGPNSGTTGFDGRAGWGGDMQAMA